MGVVVVGSVNVDLVVRLPRLPAAGETVSGGEFSRHGGGKGANQAIAAARAGASVRFVGAVGDDDLGREASALLGAEGIDVTSLVRIGGEATGVALILVDAAGENLIGVAPGANWAVDAASVEVVLRSPAPAAAVCLLGLELPDDVVLRAAQAAHEAGYRLVLNPAPARPLPDAVLELGPLLTPNAGECRVLSGVEDPESGARRLAARTNAPVVVTLGGDGVLLVAATEVRRFPAHRVAAVDATGAGDAFSGVLAAGLAAGLDLQRAVRRAQIAAALSVTTVGAREGMPLIGAIDAFDAPAD